MPTSAFFVLPPLLQPADLGIISMSETYDSPWKEVIGRFFEHFMAFFFPAAHQDIDWSRGFVSLDKELAKITRGAALGPRVADKLIKVWRRDERSSLVLVHVEAQNQRSDDFEQRIFVYNYRIFDLYELPVVSLVVLGDEHTEWRPACFGWNLWGCSLELIFPTAKLLDFASDLRVMAGSEPMAIVVSAHLATRKTRRNPGRRLEAKLFLCRKLYRWGLGRAEVLELYRLIDWFLALPPELEEEFLTRHGAFEETVKMQYITSAERLGIEKGMAKGMQQGMAKGMQQGAVALLERLLTWRFGPLSEATLGRLRKAPPSQLELWAQRALDAPDLETVFEGSADENP